MVRIFVVAAVLIALAAPAVAAPQRYEYRIEHPTYGTIGTYINEIERLGDRVQVETELRIAVKVLGVVVYRQEARRAERWRGDRFIGFEGVTITNGERLEVRGEARGAAAFAITTAAGTVMAPAGIHPSNPWSPAVLNADLMMSTQNGRVAAVRVVSDSHTPVAFAGAPQGLHLYEIVSDERQLVWFDDHGTAVAFRIEEGGVPIDFVLVR